MVPEFARLAEEAVVVERERGRTTVLGEGREGGTAGKTFAV